MNPVEKMNMSALVASILLLLTFSAFAAGIDDLTNYQSPSTHVDSSRVQPYTIEDIINILPNSLDENGVHLTDNFLLEKQNAWHSRKYRNDPRAIAFDEEKFGKCEKYYLRKYQGSNGGMIFDHTLAYLFPKNEDQKLQASHNIKNMMKDLVPSWKDDAMHRSGGVCGKWEEYNIQLKEILNAVIQAAPTILQAKHRMVAEDQATKAKQDAYILAERKKGEEQSNKLKTCQNTNEFKLYKASVIIENNHAIAKNAQLEIDRQKEIQKVSGFLDKQVMYEMGNRIVEVNKLNKENFAAYKKFGGSARNVESVHSLPNPCNM